MRRCGIGRNGRSSSSLPPAFGSTAVKYNFGLIQHHTHLPFLPTGEVAAHDGLIRLSEPRNQVFVGRERELARLRDVLRPEDGRTAVVIHGMGGVGKTALVLEYAYRYREDHNPILRLPADSPVGMTAALAAFADDLNHLLEPSGLSRDQRATWAKNWLQGHGGWLLILDNAERPADVDALLGLPRRRPHPDHHPAGHGLARAVREHWPWTSCPRTRPVEFLERLVVDGGECARFRELAGELGCLPLALEQAAAYLNQTRTDPSGYLALLRDPAAEALAIGPRRDEHERTVARVWQHSLRAAQDEPVRHLRPAGAVRVRAGPGAAQPPRPAPRGQVGAFRASGAAAVGLGPPYARRRWAQRAGWVKERGRAAHRELTGPEIDRALGVLHAYSLIRLDRESVKVHRLVQAVARTPDPAHGRSVRAARQEAVELLLGAVLDIPDGTGGWAREREMVPHLEALLRLTGPADDRVDTAALLVRLADYSSRWSRPQEGALVLGYLGRLPPGPHGLEQQLHRGLDLRGRAGAGRRPPGARGPAARTPWAGSHRSLPHPTGPLLHGVGAARAGRPAAEEGAGRRHERWRRCPPDGRRTWPARRRFRRRGGRSSVAMFERNLFDAEAALGGQDADTCDARENLADAYAASQDPLRAVGVVPAEPRAEGSPVRTSAPFGVRLPDRARARL
ncbi:hypothetical protein SCYAM73S_06148 [Streptomyces cyaneofuscatus]